MPPEFLTTKEVADLLRVKERKVYDLVSEGEIPHHRVTGKLLFPADRVTAWITGNTGPRPAVVAGSHDPLLDWAIRTSACGLATLFDGSKNGLDRFVAREAAAAGLHIPEAKGWNTETISHSSVCDAVLISWAKRTQGLILARGSPISGLQDLPGHRVVLRQPGAGSRDLFDRLTAGLDLATARFLPDPARTESDAAAAVASGEADVALGLEAAARRMGLGFVPIAEERFDLLVDRRAWFTPGFRTLLDFAGSERMKEKAQALGGYDISDLGEVRWLSD